ncbi:MAG: chemotaxis response regulator protein-glutamate methylesterase [Bryobacteraceae bacterium]|jgi:two-component system chemotaxis response regulator CheB
MSPRRRIRVLIVDDSAIVRKVLSEMLASEQDLEVVGTAPDPYVARDRILSLHPDVLTLDIEMPRMDGLTFLKKLTHFHPMPVVLISSLAPASCSAAIAAMELGGAVEVLAKPGGPYSVAELRPVLVDKIRAVAQSNRTKPTGVPAAEMLLPLAPSRPAAWRPPEGTLIAIGASTGGTEAVASIVRRLPAGMPPILIVQHIPPVFSRAFAQRLGQIGSLDVKEAEDGDRLAPGRVLVAPGDYHMILHRDARGLCVQVRSGPRVCYQRPSVDVLFLSVAEMASRRAVGVLLTGMGEDGAKGLLKMRQSGSQTMIQDEATSVVFGMPGAALKLGAAEHVVGLPSIPQRLLSMLESRPAAPAMALR